MLGACVGPDPTSSKCLQNALAVCQRAQIISQRFAFLSEAFLHELQEAFFIGDAESSAFAGQRHLHQSGIDTRRRTKGSGRNFQSDPRLGIELAQRR